MIWALSLTLDTPTLIFSAACALSVTSWKRKVPNVRFNIVGKEPSLLFIILKCDILFSRPMSIGDHARRPCLLKWNCNMPLTNGYTKGRHTFSTTSAFFEAMANSFSLTTNSCDRELTDFVASTNLESPVFMRSARTPISPCFSPYTSL